MVLQYLKNIFFICTGGLFLASFLGSNAASAATCSLNCNMTEYRRCYNVFSADSTDAVPMCKCLRGLYEYNNQCFGVIRYDLLIQIFLAPVFVDQTSATASIKEIIKNIPQNSNSSLITKDHGMDLETNLFTSSSDGKSVNVYNKVVLWKKNQANPKDLPNISLLEMQQFLQNYFKYNIRIDPLTNITLLGNLTIGIGAYDNDFLNTWSLTYNIWTCSSGEYSYCADHLQCLPNLGGVSCQCDQFYSIDVSPQKALFPGESCQYSCNKNCLNGGTCLNRNGYATCFCPDRYVGDGCEIDIILFAIISLCIIILLIILSICCGVAEFAKKRNEKKKKNENNEPYDNDTNNNNNNNNASNNENMDPSTQDHAKTQ